MLFLQLPEERRRLEVVSLGHHHSLLHVLRLFLASFPQIYLQRLLNLAILQDSLRLLIVRRAFAQLVLLLRLPRPLLRLLRLPCTLLASPTRRSRSLSSFAFSLLPFSTRTSLL